MCSINIHQVLVATDTGKTKAAPGPQTSFNLPGNHTVILTFMTIFPEIV